MGAARGFVAPARARKLQSKSCVHLFMNSAIALRASLAHERCQRGFVSGQWRAMRDGNAGTYGTDGNLVSVSYRIQRR